MFLLGSCIWDGKCFERRICFHEHSACAQEVLSKYGLVKEVKEQRDATFSSPEFPIESSTGRSTWWMFFTTIYPPQMNNSSSSSPSPPSSSSSSFLTTSCPVSRGHGVCCMAWEELSHPAYLPLRFASLCVLSRDVYVMVHSRKTKMWLPDRPSGFGIKEP